MSKIKLFLADFRHFFKLLYTTSLLIFIIEFIQRLQIYLYYADPKDILRTNALFMVLLLMAVFCIAMVVATIASLFKNRETLIEPLIELLCAIIFGLSYTYAFLSMDKTNTLLKYLWATGIAPLGAPILTGFVYLKYTQRARQWIHNVIRMLWVPLSVVSSCALLWIGVVLIAFFVNRGSVLGSVDLARIIASSARKPNIVIVTFDALTTKDMSLYGYFRKTTPSLEDFAKECYVFDNMYSSYITTTPSVVSLFTSKYPWTHKVYSPGHYLKEGRDESLFSYLPEYEMLNVIGADAANPILIGLGRPDINVKSMVPHSHLMGRIDYFLYNISHNTIPINELPLLSKITPPRERDRLFLVRTSQGRDGGYILDADEHFSMALDAIEKTERIPFFIWIHVFPPNPHVAHPHSADPPPPFLYKFTKKGDTIARDVWINDPYHIGRQGEVDKLRARYNESILYTDHCFGDFIQKLKERGLYDDSLIIVSADHGESFEKGWRGHCSRCLYDSTTNVPLLIHLPGQSKGEWIHTPAETVDISPTILDIINKPIPRWIEGESLLPYMRGDSTRTEKAKFSYTKWGGRAIAVVKDDHKLIYDLVNKSAELYNIIEDKDELVNLYSQRPDIVKKLKKHIPPNL